MHPLPLLFGYIPVFHYLKIGGSLGLLMSNTRPISHAPIHTLGTYLRWVNTPIYFESSLSAELFMYHVVKAQSAHLHPTESTALFLRLAWVSAVQQQIVLLSPISLSAGALRTSSTDHGSDILPHRG